MEIRKFLPLIFYAIFILSLACTIWISPFAGFALIIAGVFMVLSIYAVYWKIIKEENLLINNTSLQNAAMIFSLFTIFFMLVGSTFRIMHWPFAGPMLILGLIVNIIPVLLSAVDLLINFRTVRTNYGYSYLIILLPVFLFVPFNFGRIFQERESKELLALKRADDQICNLYSIHSSKNQIIIDKYLIDDSLIRQINQETHECLKHLDQTKNEIIMNTGGYEDGDKNKMYKGAKTKIPVEVMMVGQAKNGQAYKLKKMLDDYVISLNKNITDSALRINSIAPDAKDDKSILDEVLKRKDFAELNFTDVTMLQAMNTLSQLELQVVISEQQFLLYYTSLKKEQSTNN